MMKRLQILFLISILSSVALNAQLIISEDFDNYSLGLLTPQTNDWIQLSPSTPSIEVNNDGGAFLNCSGADTNENYLNYNGESCSRLVSTTGKELTILFHVKYLECNFQLLGNNNVYYNYSWANGDGYNLDVEVNIDLNTKMLTLREFGNVIQTISLPNTATVLDEIRFSGYFKLGCLTLYDYTDVDNDQYLAINDCDDNNPNVNPSMVEVIYNGLDDDCNPSTKDDDFDEDNYPLAHDCDDQNPNINPGMQEIPYNGINEDCNIATPDNDIDGDGFLYADDCDDKNSNINPGENEKPYNGIDDDCNPATKDDDLDGDGFLKPNDCDDSNADVNPNGIEVPYNGYDDDCNPSTLEDDLDNDGYLKSDDCDDQNPKINAGQQEIPYNGVDEDCNAMTPDDDLDNDGYLMANDCNDVNSNINPGVPEIPGNNIDENCDGLFTTAINDVNITAIKVGPNPNGIGYLNIENHSIIESITLYDISGMPLLIFKSQPQIDICKLQSGIYILSLTLQNGMEKTIKILKE